LDDLADEILGRTEKSMRAAIEKIPDGIYSAEELLEEPGEERKLKVKATVQQVNIDEMISSIPEGLRKNLGEFEDNIALALAVCEHLGLDTERVLKGMMRVRKDPGALGFYLLQKGKKTLTFVNAFAANDSQSTEIIWQKLNQEGYLKRPVIVIFNSRRDRPLRTLQFSHYLATKDVIAVLLIGQATRLAKRLLLKAGYPEAKIKDLGSSSMEKVYHTIWSLFEDKATVVGVGNIGGAGRALLAYLNKEVVADDVNGGHRNRHDPGIDLL
ncbi:MAG: hypothetical protein ACE5JO_11030, partial [Candidatus Binatia bacterium]